MVTVAMLTVKPVEVEFCADNGQKVLFKPTRRAERGRIDFAMVKSEHYREMHKVWKEPVPGKIAGITEGGEKYIRDPLHDKQYAKLAAIIKARGRALPDEREVFESESVLTWLFWLRRIVDSGLGRVLSGELPAIDQLDNRKRNVRDERFPRRSFILEEPPEESPAEQFTKVIERLAANVATQTAVMQQLLAKLATK